MADILPSVHGAVMRGTTPTFIYDFDFDLTELTALRLYFMQGSKVIFTKDADACEVDDSQLYVPLSQEDTYKLSAKKRLEVRCRFKRNDSPVVGTVTLFYDVLDSGKPEEALIPYVLPEYIRIVVPPNKTAYVEGFNIDLTGIVVKAYTADDEEWSGFPSGIIPIEQLATVPTIAQPIDPYGRTQTITVQWERPQDQRVLEDTYDIMVCGENPQPAQETPTAINSWITVSEALAYCLKVHKQLGGGYDFEAIYDIQDAVDFINQYDNCPCYISVGYEYGWNVLLIYVFKPVEVGEPWPATSKDVVTLSYTAGGSTVSISEATNQYVNSSSYYSFKTAAYGSRAVLFGTVNSSC